MRTAEITRNTNDVQQLQMLVMVGLTMMVLAPVTSRVVSPVTVSPTASPNKALPVTVNALAPGFTLTEASLGLMEDAASYGITRGAIKRAAGSDDMVGAALFLASPLASFITGQTLIIDGGRQFL